RGNPCLGFLMDVGFLEDSLALLEFQCSRVSMTAVHIVTVNFHICMCQLNVVIHQGIVAK
ncbi:hypothetical protein ACQP3J_31985, partial [Escherichia coli]